MTKQIKVGKIRIGGGAPIVIQSMTKVDTSDIKKVVNQVHQLEESGCEIVRVAVKDEDDAKAISAIRRDITIPLVADIHFDYKLALAAIEHGADKIRINPGNIKKREDIEKIIDAAQEKNIPLEPGMILGRRYRIVKHLAEGGEQFTGHGICV